MSHHLRGPFRLCNLNAIHVQAASAVVHGSHRRDLPLKCGGVDDMAEWDGLLWK